jgi:hypothetical protein
MLFLVKSMPISCKGRRRDRELRIMAEAVNSSRLTFHSKAYLDPGEKLTMILPVFSSLPRIHVKGRVKNCMPAKSPEGVSFEGVVELPRLNPEESEMLRKYVDFFNERERLCA